MRLQYKRSRQTLYEFPSISNKSQYMTTWTLEGLSSPEQREMVIKLIFLADVIKIKD